MTNDPETLEDDEAFQSWSRHVLETLIPTIANSEITMALVPRGATDVKFAVELGFMIMLDKPIVLLVLPGVKVPPKLARVADKIVQAGPPDEAGTALTAQRIHQALKEMTVAQA